jgi:hypothetical protein
VSDLQARLIDLKFIGDGIYAGKILVRPKAGLVLPAEMTSNSGGTEGQVFEFEADLFACKLMPKGLLEKCMQLYSAKEDLKLNNEDSYFQEVGELADAIVYKLFEHSPPFGLMDAEFERHPYLMFTGLEDYLEFDDDPDLWEAVLQKYLKSHEDIVQNENYRNSIRIGWEEEDWIRESDESPEEKNWEEEENLPGEKTEFGLELDPHEEKILAMEIEQEDLDLELDFDRILFPRGSYGEVEVNVFFECHSNPVFDGSATRFWKKNSNGRWEEVLKDEPWSEERNNPGE